jgi:hypothetical protein
VFPVCVDADEDDEKDDLISAVQFLLILEESIRTFMAFLRADKRSRYEMFREMVKKRRASAAVDQTLVVTLKKANKKVSRLDHALRCVALCGKLNQFKYSN